jgi:uncharacterized protein (DUF433 family)
MATVQYPHISVAADGVPVLTGTGAKVLMIVMDHVGQGWDAQEIQRQYPHLSLGQIHGALAYYYDHKPEMDAEMQRDLREADRVMQEVEALQGPSRLKETLDANGKLP